MATTPVTGSIVVARTPGKRDRLRDYRVIVDGTERATLGEGRSTTVQLVAGEHDIWIKVDGARSRKIHVELHPGAQIYLICQAGGTALMTLFDGIFRVHRYVALDEATEDIVSAVLPKPLTFEQVTKAVDSAIVVPLVVVAVLLPVLLIVHAAAWLSATIICLVVAIAVARMVARSLDP